MSDGNQMQDTHAQFILAKSEKFEYKTLISTVGPTVHTNTSRKRGFPKTLLKPEESENVALFLRLNSSNWRRLKTLKLALKITPIPEVFLDFSPRERALRLVFTALRLSRSSLMRWKIKPGKFENVALSRKRSFRNRSSNWRSSKSPALRFGRKTFWKRRFSAKTMRPRY